MQQMEVVSARTVAAAAETVLVVVVVVVRWVHFLEVVVVQPRVAGQLSLGLQRGFRPLLAGS